MKGIGSRILNRHRCLRVSSALSLFAGILISTGCQITIAESTTTLEYRVFPGLAQMDGNWAALLAASDGKVYVGLACHGCSGHLVFYDSVKDKVVDLGDLNSLAGQSGLDVGPQSKIHARFGEGRDGRIDRESVV